MDVARGELIFFTDSDCTVAPDYLDHMVSAFDRTDAAAVSGKVITPAPPSYAVTVVGWSRCKP
jgi:cellulose synthase/poly-beta-1,6-N-acetylglucosamine synthase-like glycosyltransferase